MRTYTHKLLNLALLEALVELAALGGCKSVFCCDDVSSWSLSVGFFLSFARETPIELCLAVLTHPFLSKVVVIVR